MIPGKKSLSVVIPTLNESSTINHLIDQLRNQVDVQLQIIIVDGGSSDDTTTRIKAQIVKSTLSGGSGINLLTTEPGRGHQLNVGCQNATHEYLLCLHSDSELTNPRQLLDALEVLENQCDPDMVAGHFSLSFQLSPCTPTGRLKYFESKSDLNRPGTFNGDQGLLIKRDILASFGGFSEELPILEDQDFGNRFSLQGHFITLPSPIITSARRFETEGIVERITLNTLIMAMFHLGLFDFFKQAPEIYKSQTHAKRLNVLPFLVLTLRTVFNEGYWVALQRLYQLGSYARSNFWQVFLLIDVLKGNSEPSSNSNLSSSSDDDSRNPVLAFYDRNLVKILSNPIANLMGTCIVMTWFAGLLAWKFTHSKITHSRMALT